MENEMITYGHGVSFRDNENILKLVVMAVQICEYTKNHLTEQFKRVNFMVCELYLNKADEKKSVLFQIHSLLVRWVF